jgi:predicted MFS family arabinose efflux permease
MSAGLLTAAVGIGALDSVAPTTAGLFLLGFGNGSWDVAMNIEGAAVERRLRKSVMPRFHAAFSLGTVTGGLVGTLAAWANVGVGRHIGVASVIVAVACGLWARGFLPADRPSQRPAGAHPLRAWTEPRTLVIGVMVLAMALTEGVANDWLALAVVDGYDAPGWLGSAAFALFVAAMTTGRVLGTSVLDTFGRVRVLWTSMAVAACGVLLVVFGQVTPLVALGVVLWGMGASLGFPVGMSAAADDPAHAAERVSVVSTIGYLAFLGGPPLLGFLGSQFGVLDALLFVAVMLVPSAVAVPAARKPAVGERPR